MFERRTPVWETPWVRHLLTSNTMWNLSQSRFFVRTSAYALSRRWMDSGIRTFRDFFLDAEQQAAAKSISTGYRQT